MNAEIYTKKGQYLPGEPIALCLECDVDADQVDIELYSLGHKVSEFSFPITGALTDIELPSIETTFAGYGVKAALKKGEEQRANVFTAFDVAAHGKVVRYGFLSDFSENDADDRDVSAMAKYHVNTVQFYDWSYRPDMLVAPADKYSDLMGKQNCLQTVKAKIAQCHEYGMRAVGYGAVYAASESYRCDHPDQSLFARQDNPLCFIGKFYIMNISKGCPWHDHIIAEYKHAASLGFDGFHMDTYGFPKTALDADGQMVYLEEHFNELIEDTKEALQAVAPEPCLIFNNVGGWPVEITKFAPQECVYIEVWPPNDRYSHLKQLILSAKSTGKPVVLAAYPVPFHKDTKQRALESELLCALAIALNGASQLFIGEHNAVITQGYYADYTRLDHGQIMKIRAYQDFFVQYEELLFDDTLKDVSFTHIGWDNVEYACDADYSVSGEAGKLWLNIRENKHIKLIGMVNLNGNDDLWNEGKEKPKDLYNVTFSVLTHKPVSRVCFASPDINGGLAEALEFSTQVSEKGELTAVTIPHIIHGGLLWMEV